MHAGLINKIRQKMMTKIMTQWRQKWIKNNNINDDNENSSSI